MRYILMPSIGDGLTIQTARRAKYLDPDSVAPGWVVDKRGGHYMEYGQENLYLVAVALRANQAALLDGFSDVFVFPEDLATPLDPVVVRPLLRMVNLPAGDLTVATTYGDLLARVARVMQLMQRWRERGQPRLFSGRTVESVATQAQKDALLETALTFRGVTAQPATTLDDVLRTMANQIFPEGVKLGDELH